VLAHLLLAVLSQTPAPPQPKLAVLVTQRAGLTDARAEALAAKVADVLSSKGVEIGRGPKESAQALSNAGMKSTDCQGKRGCISGLGRVLRVWAVLGVDLADLDGTLAVHLELIDSDRGDRLAQLDFVTPSKRAESEIPAQVQPLAPKLKELLDIAKVAAAPAPQPEPAPVLTPKSEPEQPLTHAVRAVEPSRPLALPIGLLAAGVAAGVVSIIFVVLAGGARDQLNAGTSGSPFSLTRSAAQQLVTRANTDYSVALGTGIGAGALALGGVLAWVLP
jgi:hypothetical protein